MISVKDVLKTHVMFLQALIQVLHNKRHFSTITTPTTTTNHNNNYNNNNYNKHLYT